MAAGYALGVILATRGFATAIQSFVSSSIERSRRPALKNRVSFASRASSTTIDKAGLSAKGGTAPMTQPVSSCAVSGEAKPHFLASNRAATAAKSSLLEPGRMASTGRLPPPPPLTSSTMALAACSGRLPRMALIASDLPSAACSMTRNFAFASLSSATSWSNTSPFERSTPTDHLLGQNLERLVEARYLAVGRRDGGIDAAAQALLRGHRHQRLDAGLAQGLGDQAHLFPAPVGMHDVGLHQRREVIAEVHEIDIGEAVHHLLADALPLGRHQRLDAQRLEPLHHDRAHHLHRRRAAGTGAEILGVEAAGVHPGDGGFGIVTRDQHLGLDATLEEAAHHGDVDVATAAFLDLAAVLVRHLARDSAEVEVTRALLHQGSCRKCGISRMLALHGADHEVGFGKGRGVVGADRDIEAACLFAQRRAARVLVEGGVDRDHAARGVVTGSGNTATAAVGCESARDGGACLAETDQGDDVRRNRHQEAGASPSSLRAAIWVSREAAMRSLGRTVTTSFEVRSAMPAYSCLPDSITETPAKRPSQRWPKRSTVGAMRSARREWVGGMNRARPWRSGANMLARSRLATWPG